MITTFHGRWKFPKARKLSYGELHYSFSSEYRKYSGGDTAAFILSLFLPISLRLFSIVNPSRTRGFPHAHVPKGRSGEIMNETSAGKGERPNVFHVRPSLIFSFPTGVGTNARNNANNKRVVDCRIFLSSLIDRRCFNRIASTHNIF